MLVVRRAVPDARHACAASLIAALAIPLAMGDRASSAWCASASPATSCRSGAIDFGLLVDGAIVMLEAALAQLGAPTHRRARTIAPRWSRRRCASAARPVTFALAIILLVYLPLMALEGVEGRMFQPMAITVALALGGALVFSLTAFPALARYAAARRRSTTHDESQGVFGALRRVYARAAASASWRARAAAGRRGAALWSARGAGRARARRRVRAAARRGRARRSTSSACRRSPSPRRSGWACRSRRCWRASRRCVDRDAHRAAPRWRPIPVGPDETEVMVKLRPKEEWTTAHDLDEPRRDDEGGGRARGAGDLRRRVAADRGSRQPAAGRARAPTW